MSAKISDKSRVRKIIEILIRLYPNAVCQLNSQNPLELLIATRLSAQCTDVRVNIVTPNLFAKFKDVTEFANANVTDVEDCIKSCGLYKTKAADIVAMCKMIISDFGGNVPNSLEDLCKLQGVGRKTANLIMGDIYGKPAVVCDTHLIRISNRLGFVTTKDPYKVEVALKKLLPQAESNEFCHRIVLHGRAVCTARSPACEKCGLSEYCPKVSVT